MSIVSITAKRDPQFTCSQYSKIPCGTLCGTQHRIRAEDMEKGIFTTVSQLPRQEPRKATLPASAAV